MGLFVPETIVRLLKIFATESAYFIFLRGIFLLGFLRDPGVLG